MTINIVDQRVEPETNGAGTDSTAVTPARNRSDGARPAPNRSHAARRREPATESPDSIGTPPYSIALNDGDTPHDVIDALALGPFTAGTQPYARSAVITRARADAPLMPAGATVARSSTGIGSHAHLVVGDGWTLRAVRWSNRRAAVTVTAVSDDLAERVLDEATTDAAEEPVETRVPIGFWHMVHSAMRTERMFARQPWTDIRRNYAATATAQFDRLMQVRPPGIGGRLLLLHGAPGTGKTTALRSIATEWRDWCQIDCVLDAERLFNDARYLTNVVIGMDNERDDDGDSDASGNAGRRWRMLLLEDCDELIRAEAKATTGQALSRLLNLTDGLFGHGRQVLVAITTNEDLARLHPATVRPGRCLAQIEVGRLPRDQAIAWLGSSAGIGSGGATLAELYALKSGDRAAKIEAPAATGMYL